MRGLRAFVTDIELASNIIKNSGINITLNKLGVFELLHILKWSSCNFYH